MIQHFLMHVIVDYLQLFVKNYLIFLKFIFYQNKKLRFGFLKIEKKRSIT